MQATTSAPAGTPPSKTIKSRWLNSIPTLRTTTAAKLLDLATPTIREYVTKGRLDALRWHDNSWRVSARAVAKELHRRHGVYLVPGNTVFGTHTVATLEEQTLRMMVHMGEMEPRATVNEDGVMQQLYTVPYEEHKYHARRLRTLLEAAIAPALPGSSTPPGPSTRQIKAADLNPGDYLVAAFPRGTTAAQVPSLVEEGWLVVDVELMDHPGTHARHMDGRPMTEDDMAERHPLTVTHASLGRDTILVSIALPDGKSHSRHLSRHTTVRIVR